MTKAANIRSGLVVGAAEAGVKLLRFLERRFDQPKSVLYKWIRTGQVRVNGCRADAHAPLAGGDVVRVPPFAVTCRQTDTQSPAARVGAKCLELGPGLDLLAQSGDILVLAKASGLASQPGSANEDNVCARLAKAFTGSAFVPAPAHRLDRHTSGLMLAGLSHAAQQCLHTLIKEGGLAKNYLAWCAGSFVCERSCLLYDRLHVIRKNGIELVAARPGGSVQSLFPGSGACYYPLVPASVPGPDPASGHVPVRSADVRAVCALTVVSRLAPQDLPKNPRGAPAVLAGGATLLLIRLLTGRRHQIRVQLASRGHPVIGDGRYGGPRFTPMLLHAFGLCFAAPGSGEPLTFCAPPDWRTPFMPAPDALADAVVRLDAALA